MAVAKMKLVNIVGVTSAFEKTVQRCCRGVPFHPELPEEASHSSEFSVGNEPNPYEDILKLFIDTAGRAGIQLYFDESSENLTMSVDEIQEYIQDISRRQDALLEELKQNQSKKLYDQQVLYQINMMQEMNVNIDELFSCKSAKIRFGRIPVDNLVKIKLYEQNPYLFFFPFSQDDNYCWCVYFTTESHAAEIDQLMTSLFFERIRIPEFVHGTPDEAKAEIGRMISEIDRKLEETKSKLQQLWENEKQRFIQAYDQIRFLHDSYELKRYTLRYNNSFYISGWVEEEEAEKFAAQFKDLEGVDCLLFDPEAGLGYDPPVKLKNHRLFQPFEGFISLYGMPDYHEIDPTPIVAISYMLLFGIMFADLGQGFVCVLLGWLLWKTKKMFLGRIMQRIGVVSMIFGTIFGSVFGNETLLDPMFHALGFEEKPIEVLSSDFTTTLLISAICVGIVFIMVAIVMNIINGIRMKDLGRVLVSQNGIVGLIMYGGTLTAIALMMLLQINVFNPLFIIGIIVIPLLIIFLQEPLNELLHKRKPHKPDSMAEFILQNFFELFEIILSFFSNTISFVRVGALVISHAGMMMVVMNIAESVGGAAAPFVWVFGNILVMALEGMIVGIQALRLEFYEIFSRFYSGSGRSFEPFKINYEIQNDSVES